MWFFTRRTTLAQGGLLNGLVDCHSHLLPGVDDGIQSLPETLQLLEEMAQHGVRKVWLTPHVMEDVPNETESLRHAFQQLQQQYTGPIELALAAEYMLDNLFEQRLAADDLLPMEEGKRYLLVETSYYNPPMRLHPLLQAIRSKGYYPLLAHPERYRYLEKSDYEELQAAGVSFQLNIPSLTGLYGREVQERAYWLLEKNRYQRCGGDTHRSSIWRASFTQERIPKRLIRPLQEITG